MQNGSADQDLDRLLTAGALLRLAAAKLFEVSDRPVAGEGALYVRSRSRKAAALAQEAAALLREPIERLIGEAARAGLSRDQ